MTKSKNNVFRILFSALLFLVLSLSLALCGTSASAESLDELRSDFRKNSDGWTLNDFAVTSSEGLTLIPSAEAKTVGTMDSLLLFLEFGEVEGSFKLSLGVTSDTAACSLTFKDNRLTVEGLVDESGGNTAVLERGLLSGSTLKVEMIGGYVEISIRNAQDPYDYLGSPVATLYFEEGKTSAEGNIALSVEEKSATIETANLYSLDGSIHIDTEDYVPPKEEDSSGSSESSSGGCGSVAGISAGLAVLAAGAAIALKKGGRHEKNR